MLDKIKAYLQDVKEVFTGVKEAFSYTLSEPVDISVFEEDMEK